MDTTAPVDSFESAMTVKAHEKYATDPLRLPMALAAIGAYCSAWRAYLRLVGNTITSYSVAGRSVTKAAASSANMRDCYRRLRSFFDELPEELADSAGASVVVSVDFSRA